MQTQHTHELNVMIFLEAHFIYKNIKFHIKYTNIESTTEHKQLQNFHIQLNPVWLLFINKKLQFLL